MTDSKPREIAEELSKTMQCNCDLDNWEPDPRTGHSYVCRIHNTAMQRVSTRWTWPPQ